MFSLVPTIAKLFWVSGLKLLIPLLMGLFDFVSLPVSLSHLRAGVSIFEKKGGNDFGRSIALIDLDKKVITKRRC